MMEVENDEVDFVVLNNLLDAQLKIASNECEDIAILENILYNDAERSFFALDKATSTKIFRSLEEVDPERKVQCSHCNLVFTNEDHKMHVCSYDEDNKLISAVEVADQEETETEKSLRCTLSQLKSNNCKISSLLNENEKNFECTKCCRKFVHETGLYRHWNLHIGELLEPTPEVNPEVKKSVTLCKLCGEVFGLEADALNHMLSNHFEIVESYPRTAGGNLQIKAIQNGSKEDLKTNKDSEPGFEASIPRYGSTPQIFQNILVSSIYQCEYCESSFLNNRHMFLHTSKHAPLQGFSCKKCEQKDLSLKDILLHRRDDCVFLMNPRNPLRDFPRIWMCNVCDEEFHGLEQLVIHRQENCHFFPRIEPKVNSLIFSCPFCLEIFLFAPDLIDHFDKNHSKKSKPEAPLETSERIAKEPTNRRGGSHQTSDKPRCYLCEVCGKSYTQSSHLWQHLRFHQGVKPFACLVEGCDRKFTIRPDLNDHVRKCHTGERPYLCTICGKRFLTGSVYYQHRLIHRGERRYGCEECDKRFYRADALKNHMRIHTGEKPHSCSECGKTFRQRGDRDKHIKARHPYANVIPSPRKQRVKSFGRGRIKNNVSLYQSMPEP